ncbi:MAG TPA: aminotransferase class I/II-fold pyridoxal phosphate-dependent enzyme [Egicoccus sp.]|nr:aminotransferase class I/II-fold pyridoxal phosphate-dependent enzyme [Egicoccus sp.]HSK24160.1 aminotransferase class I/II-fold pyridoxal phosphate-dependent enzyme [Egicoccus sp.]
MAADPLVLPLDRLRRRTSIKWRLFGPDVLPLWVAEMDVDLAPAVADALHTAIDEGDTGYASGAGYVDAMAAFARSRWAWVLPTARARIVPDVMRGVAETLAVVTGPGAPVIVTPPVYAPFYAFVRHAGREVVEVPLGRDGRLDLDHLAVAMASAAGRGAFLLCSPHNPHGTVHTRDELEVVATLAADHGIRVVSDEIHAPLVLTGGFVPYLDVAGTDDAVAVLSASKGWNLPGLKAAVAVAGEAAVDDLARIPEIVTHGATHLGVIAQTAALRDGRDWLDALLVALAERRRLLTDLLARHLPDVRWRPGDATYLAWLDGRDLGLAGSPARHFLDHANVALVDGAEFGTGGAGHMRLNFATSTAILTEAVERMALAR